jgi:endonuclease/exonuclease/phosphatase (EEP) superfamily protein YafD
VNRGRRVPPPSKEAYLKRSALAVALAAIAALAIPAGAGAAKDDGKVKVLLRNLYLGAPIDQTLPQAQSIAEFTSLAADAIAEMERTSYPERVKLLAAEIRKEKPDLVGLNEAAIWRFDTADPDGDYGPPIFPNATPAEELRYDFLRMLVDELAAQGQNYEVAAVQQELDAEGAVDDRPNDIHEDPDDPDGDYDARITQRDAILVRKGAGVKYSKPNGANFDAAFTPTLAGALQVPFLRGWTSIEANVRGTKFRFLVTHLESAEDPSNSQQARELVKGPADTDKNVVLVGDFNSDPEGNAQDRKAYDIIRKAGFVERQIKGPTYGHEMSLSNPNDQANFQRKIDYIMVSNPEIKLNKGKSSKFGIDGPRTPSGLWPSDHAGLFSSLRFP